MIILLQKGGFGLCLIFHQKNHCQIQIIGQKQSKKETVISNNQYSVIDGGIYTLGDTYIIGENHLEASKYLEEKYNLAISSESTLSYEKETEQKFGVQIWDSTDFSINKLREKLKNQ